MAVILLEDKNKKVSIVKRTFECDVLHTCSFATQEKTLCNNNKITRSSVLVASYLEIRIKGFR